MRNGVYNLFKAEKHTSVCPLIGAFENRLFNGRCLKDVAIRETFYQGTLRSIKGIVKEFHDHPAITSREYANRLRDSCVYVESKTSFPFLLAHADQGDLEEAKALALQKICRTP